MHAHTFGLDRKMTAPVPFLTSLAFSRCMSTPACFCVSRLLFASSRENIQRTVYFPIVGKDTIGERDTRRHSSTADLFWDTAIFCTSGQFVGCLYLLSHHFMNGSSQGSLKKWLPKTWSLTSPFYRELCYFTDAAFLKRIHNEERICKYLHQDGQGPKSYPPYLCRQRGEKKNLIKMNIN